MEESKFAPGSLVYYVDVDLVRWGPWRVIRAEKAIVTVLVDDRLVLRLPLNKVREDSVYP